MDQPDTLAPGGTLLDLQGILRDYIAASVVAVDAGGVIRGLTWNFDSNTGPASSPTIGGSIASLGRPLQELIAETFKTRASIANRQLALPSTSGAPCAVIASTVVCAGADGEAAGVVVTLRSRTAFHQLDAGVQRLDRLASIGALSASMAHEIKNALVAVHTFVEDLIERNRDAELAGLVHRELQRVDSIVSQMLKLAGPGRPAFETLSLHRIVDQSVRLVQPQLQARNIQLEREFRASSDHVQADEYQFEQALLNLFLNSIAAVDRDGALRLKTEVVSGKEGSERSIQLTVADSGSGIAPENLPRLFEPFFSTKPNGTGLGLAITRRIVLEHKGQITVESEPGKGAAFRIILPLVAE